MTFGCFRLHFDVNSLGARNLDVIRLLVKGSEVSMRTYQFCLFILVFVMSAQTYAQATNLCGEIQRLRVWPNGGDHYGIWVEYKENPSQCPGGFYIKQDSNNKDVAVSMLLTARAMKERICVQVISGDMIGSRCRLNYVMNP